MTIFGWFEQYQRSLTRVGVADILEGQETVYRWGADARDGTGAGGRHAHRGGRSRRQARNEETRPRHRHVSPSGPEPARRNGAGGSRPTDDPPRRALSLGYNSPGARHRAAGARPVEARRIDRSAHGRNGGRLVSGRIVQISVSRGGVPKTTIEQAHVT